jgi:hypothetical protein
MARGFGVKWHGMTENRAALKTLARDLTAEAAPLTEQYAEALAGAVIAAYASRTITGELAAGVVVYPKRMKSRYATGFRVRSTAFYARFLEYGTKWIAPIRVFIPRRNAYQRALGRALERMMETFNLRTRGEVDIGGA